MPYLRVTWHNPVTGRPGYLVIDRLVRGGNFGGIDRTEPRPGDVQLLLSAWLDVEAANMPVTTAAEPGLTARGVLVIPDVVANSATDSWWWTLFGDIAPNAEAAFAKIRRTMRQLVTNVLSLDEPPRLAAARLAAAADANRFGPATV